MGSHSNQHTTCARSPSIAVHGWSSALRSGLRRGCAVAAVCLVSGLLLLGTSSLTSTVARASETKAQLEQRLKTSRDFRVRMQAALDLGRIKARSARTTIERALSDESSAVRAAAAAALSSIGDRSALPALKAARNDPSEAVRNQVNAAIEKLEAQVAVQYLVQVGEVDGDATATAAFAKKTLKRVAQRRLRRVPEARYEQGYPAAEGGLPHVVLDARISRMTVKRHSSRLEVSAKVDFVVSRLPGREIKGRLSGAATIHGDPNAAGRPREVQRLRLEAVEAATDVALENVGPALRAAAD